VLVKAIAPDNASTKNVTLIKSMYVHFPNDYYSFNYMCAQLYSCNDYASATLMLFNFEKFFNGKLYLSPFVQDFAKNKIFTTKGENDQEWCWWYWLGGNEGFQIIISLCQ
jgi:hypothetical protein